MSKANFLNNQALRLIFFGGKGGVGKTTLACAAGVYLAKNKPDKKLLIISVDPSHSLSDNFGTEIGDRVTPVQWSGVRGQKSEVRGQRAEVRGQKSEDGGRGAEVRGSTINNQQSTINNLFARELDVGQLSDNFKKKYLPVIKSIALNGTYLDEQDVSNLFSLSIPGLDEVTVILEIARLYKSRQYDLIIIDTAACGHIFRFLTFYTQMRKWLRLFQLMKLKHRHISTVFTGSYIKDDTDAFLETMDKDIEDVKFFFKDIKSTEFIPVLTPEAMTIKETERLIGVLKEEKIPVRDVIINHILDEKEQSIALDRVHKRFKRYNIIKLPLFSKEIRGLEDLERIAKVLVNGYQPLESTILVERCPVPYSNMNFRTQTNQYMFEMFDNRKLRFIIFGGKAGSGKTSLASATAIHLADEYPDKKIMLFSIDPAHSSSHSFDLPIGNKETSIPGFHNLYAMEVDGDRVWDKRKIEYKKDISQAFSRYRDNPEGSLDVVSSEVKFDKEIMTGFVEATPPHVDETMAVEKLMEFVINDKYDLYILDTGPIVQQLCFLGLPSITLAWIKAVINVLHKYRKFIRFDEPISKLLLLRRDMRKMANILTNESVTAFVTVTTPSALGVLEIERLLFKIGQEGIPNQHIVINKVIPSIKHFDNKHLTGSKHKISQVPLFSYEITGLHNLKSFSEAIYAREAMAESA